MTAQTRDEVDRALFELVGASPLFRTKSRKLRHWADVREADMPAIFQAKGAEQIEGSQAGLDAKKLYRYDLYLYATVERGDDNEATPHSVMNGLLDALELALAPSPVTGQQTLGGLVTHCYINGTIETDEGALGDIAVAIVPIEIRVNR